MHFFYIGVGGMSRQSEWRFYNKKAERMAMLPDEDVLADDNYGLPTEQEGSSAESEITLDSDFSLDDLGGDDNVSQECDADSSVQEPLLVQDLGFWARDSALSLLVLTNLLHILHKHGIDVPLDARTVYKTPKQNTVQRKCGGDYCYLGLRNGLVNCLQTVATSFTDSVIHLKVNIDGIPLYESNASSLWPIVCSFALFAPFAVCLFYGEQKPDPVELYLAEFLAEFSELYTNGFMYDGILRKVQFKVFICDAPARQMLKCIKGHTGYHCCERCVVRGYCHNGSHVVHSNVTEDLRTEEDFNRVKYKDPDSQIESHQHKRSPLVGAVHCVRQFALDYMHLVCLGVMKRLLRYWKRGAPGGRTGKVAQVQLEVVSDRLKQLVHSIPGDFARKPRPIKHSDRWKATEFRQFLLYTGPVVLRGILPKEYYQHFLTLSTAISILLTSDSRKRRSLLQYCRQLLRYFVDKSLELYTPAFVSYNVHSILHLPDDCLTFDGSLNDFSAFPYENFLFQLKKKVKCGQRPVVQLEKRLAEEKAIKYSKHCSKRHKLEVIPNRDCFLITGSQYAFVKEDEGNGKFSCDIISLRHCEDFYENPLSSKLLNISYFPRRCRTYMTRETVNDSNFLHRVITVQYKDGHVLMPLLHHM